jgi:predicted transposase YbfD/YdcC
VPSRKIIDKSADYVLALKDNQGTLREDVEVFVEEPKANGFQHATIRRSTAITAASKPARQQSSTTPTGSASAMTGPV